MFFLGRYTHPVNPRVIQALRERARRRHRKARQYRPPAFPAGAETRYRRALVAYVRAIRDAVRQYVLPVLDQDGDGVANLVPTGDLNRAWARVATATVGPEHAAKQAARRMIAETNQKNLEGLNAAYKTAIGVAPFTYTGGFRRSDAPTSVDEILSTRLRDNVALITSIAPTALTQVQEVIGEGFRSGLRVEDLAKRIEERFGVAESRATLIARDQVGKLQGQLTEARNREIGATSYVWQVSGAPDGDERVRDMHRELQGQTFRYDDPPVTNPQGDRNNPGEDFQCRCNALPVLEDVLAALGI